MYRLIVLASIGAALANAQAKGPGVNFYSREKETALGAQLEAQVRSESRVIDNAPINDYLARVGDRLVAMLPDKRFKYTFTVVDRNLGGSTSEPLALPAGYIFVPVNLLLATRSEHELAGMLAHSIAHVEARHATRQATRGEIANVTAVPLIFVDSIGADDNSLLPSGFAIWQQAFEKEADVMAVAIMAMAGYDPEALASYISRMQHVQQELTAKMSSAFASRDQRVAAIRAAIKQGPQNEFSTMQDELHRVLTPNPRAK